MIDYEGVVRGDIWGRIERQEGLVIVDLNRKVRREVKDCLHRFTWGLG